MSMKKHQLKSCPFCGGKAILNTYKSLKADGKWVTCHFVECVSCHIGTKDFLEYNQSKEHCINKAVEFWNRRLEPMFLPTMPSEARALEHTLRDLEVCKKALDKACECLADIYVPYDEADARRHTHSAEEWKEVLMKHD